MHNDAIMDEIALLTLDVDFDEVIVNLDTDTSINTTIDSVVQNVSETDLFSWGGNFSNF